MIARVEVYLLTTCARDASSGIRGNNCASREYVLHGQCKSYISLPRKDFVAF